MNNVPYCIRSLLEGEVFSRVCLSVCHSICSQREGPHVTCSNLFTPPLPAQTLSPHPFKLVSKRTVDLCLTVLLVVRWNWEVYLETMQNFPVLCLMVVVSIVGAAPIDDTVERLQRKMEEMERNYQSYTSSHFNLLSWIMLDLRFQQLIKYIRTNYPV